MVVCSECIEAVGKYAQRLGEAAKEVPSPCFLLHVMRFRSIGGSVSRNYNVVMKKKMARAR